MKTIQTLVSPVVALALAIGALLAVPSFVSAGKAPPNPFAGDFCNDTWQLTITTRGRVEGDFSGNDVSGTITEDGLLDLTFSSFFRGTRNSVWGNWGPTHSTVSAVGIAELDADGNLHIYVVWESGAEMTTVLLPCQ